MMSARQREREEELKRKQEAKEDKKRLREEK